MRQKSKESILMGTISFLAPFLGTLFVCHYLLHWAWAPAKLAGVALSTTSLAVVYAVLVETGLTHTEIGKVIMAATFVTDFGTVLGLSLLFISPNSNTVWFVVISTGIIAASPSIVPRLFRRYGERVIEPEIKLVFLVLLVLMFFAHLGSSHSVHPC
jgi:Kef-type K+ transport system membrane component KefB